MQFDIITLFPDSIKLDHSIIGRAVENSLIEINIHNLREWGLGNRKTVDDKPFGGGAGMILMFEPIYKSLKAIDAYPNTDPKTKIIMTSAGGRQLNQNRVQTYSKELSRMVIICGHYEGVDQRVIDELVDEEISIGPYVLTGGELPAQVIIDSVARLIPGVLGNEQSLAEESHGGFAKEHPQYTRPAEYITEEGKPLKIPPILLSGHHQQIKDWRQQQSN